MYRLTLYPGVAHFSDLLKANMRETSRLILSEFDLPQTQTPVGLYLKAVKQSRVLAGIKHTSLTETFYLRRRAVSEGFDDFLWMNDDDTIAEASTSNVFGIIGGNFVTPSVSAHGCLPGITRQQIIQLALASGQDREDAFKVEQTDIRSHDLASFEGFFLTNAVSGIMPVAMVAVDDREIPIAWSETARIMIAGLQLMLNELQVASVIELQPAARKEYSGRPRR